MTITASNKLLQASVGYLIQEQAGAVVKSDLTISYDIDSAVSSSAVFGYGYAAIIGDNKGARPATSGDTVATLLGFVGFENAGIIDNSGLPNSLYSNVPVLKRGEIYLASSGSLDIGATVGLCIDSTKAAYNKIVDITGGTPTGCTDISTVCSVLKKAANNVCLVQVRVLK